LETSGVREAGLTLLVAAAEEESVLNITKVFGPPGSGKTTFLLSIVEHELESGVAPSQIGYFAFTRKAANEAKERGVAKFPHLNPETDFPWFRTLHSLAYRCLGLGSKDMMAPEHYQEFAREAGITLNTDMGEEDFIVKTDHPILNEINIARIKGLDLREHYNRSEIEIEWYFFELIERAYRHYKEARSLLDFTDLLELIVQQPDRLPSLEALIIDEAQDLSLLQWRLVEQLALRAQRCFLAGDDDQAIYTWAGADVASFLSFQGTIKVLDQSYRVPSKVHALANNVVHRIRTRQPKTWRARAEEGSVHYYDDWQSVDVTQGDWLVLAAANYMLTGLHDWLKAQGLLFERFGQRSVPESVLTAVIGWERLRKGQSVPLDVVRTIYKFLDTRFVKHGYKGLKGVDPAALYTMDLLKEKHGLLSTEIWHEVLTRIAENQRRYVIALLRRGVKLTGKVPIKLSTIHAAKGGEADNVLLIGDLTTKFAREYDRNADDINRLLYVAVTRAKQSLHIVLPKDERKGFRL
jgi:DNA helicase-2/ATP-dependent DNA helicase PcrA